MSDIKTLLDYLCKNIDIGTKKQKEELIKVYVKECMQDGNR